MRLPCLVARDAPTPLIDASPVQPSVPFDMSRLHPQPRFCKACRILRVSVSSGGLQRLTLPQRPVTGPDSLFNSARDMVVLTQVPYTTPCSVNHPMCHVSSHDHVVPPYHFMYHLPCPMYPVPSAMYNVSFCNAVPIHSPSPLPLSPPPQTPQPPSASGTRLTG